MKEKEGSNLPASQNTRSFSPPDPSPDEPSAFLWRGAAPALGASSRPPLDPLHVSHVLGSQARVQGSRWGWHQLALFGSSVSQCPQPLPTRLPSESFASSPALL